MKSLALAAMLLATLADAGTAPGRRRRSVRFPSTPPPLVARTVVLTPAKDNTLIQTTNGDLSNGAGPHLFAGNTNARTLRRALLAFDVASQIPPGSQVTRVVLRVRVTQSIASPHQMTLHRVTADWGEGASNAGFFQSGRGAVSQTGDATWIHTFFPDSRWTTAGGDFEPVPDATAIDAGEIVWESPAMIERVQQWVDQPSTNFGWIVRGNESLPTTTKRFDSREVQPGESRPSLTIEFNGRP